jgi:hypothetical protein
MLLRFRVLAALLGSAFAQPPSTKETASAAGATHTVAVGAVCASELEESDNSGTSNANGISGRIQFLSKSGVCSCRRHHR